MDAIVGVFFAFCFDYRFFLSHSLSLSHAMFIEGVAVCGICYCIYIHTHVCVYGYDGVIIFIGF